ncbi:helix-turn-helix domain-containing protein [Deinococcus kurensis]|uniref:helix-turn-helix domain-containing protein n=1 Tax=Deinococcus kurensis TaxID=2662757 RepID=UPI00353107BD
MLLPGLKAARSKAGLTQEQLAAAAGISSATVFKHEQGQVKGVNGKTLEALSRALGVDAAALFLPAHSESSE